MKKIFTYILSLILFASCNESVKLKIEVFETSAKGKKLEKVTDFVQSDSGTVIEILPNQKFQKIIGFGGAFTESSAYLLNQISLKNRNEILKAYFDTSGSNYTLTRTHINSCDFSLDHYSYAPVEGDTLLQNFSIKEDMDDIIPMIKDALAISAEGFKIISSPWTAPPWMKDNNDWMGGKLLPEYYKSWALFFSKYLAAYKEQGIDIWAFTVENEPLGNGGAWESMLFSPEEMINFTNNFLGPKLKEDGWDVKLFGYDQNKGTELVDWAKALYQNAQTSEYFDGIALHWYGSTFDWMPESINKTHELNPDKHIIHTEACVDNEIPHWDEDSWYWEKEATDWGWEWLSGDDKKMHPKYVPVYRYARDIIGCLNNWVEGWVDWNMVLDKNGGPNWAKNWCIAPVLVDTENDKVYYTPLYYTLAHFSKYIRPDATRIGFKTNDDELMVTAVENPDGNIAVIVLNMTEKIKPITLTLDNKKTDISIDAQSIQTIIISNIE